jgi:hypothetical protein
LKNVENKFKQRILTRWTICFWYWWF